MATFAQTASPTPFSVFDADSIFKVEADQVVTYVQRLLGSDVISVELTKKSIWACFEEAALEYSRILNEHNARNQLQNLLGHATGSLSGSQNAFMKDSLTFWRRQAEPYARWAGLGGDYRTVLGQIDLQQSKQDYDLCVDLKNSAGTSIYESQPTGSKEPLRVIEVFHFSPSSAYRFFDSTSAINYLNNEFSFESFTPETIFYVLPVFEDILRAGQMNLSQRVRRSNYSYEIIGQNIRIYPMPTSTDPKNLYIRVATYSDPMNQHAASTAGGIIHDDSVYGVSSISNAPFGVIMYETVNSVGRQWIRQYCLASCKELLGLIRSKFATIPIPGAELTLDGERLVTQGREDKEGLRSRLKETLDTLTFDAILTREGEKVDSIMKKLRAVPMPKPITIG